MVCRIFKAVKICLILQLFYLIINLLISFMSFSMSPFLPRYSIAELW